MSVREPWFSVLRLRLGVAWFCRVRGRCIVCGRRAPRRGDASGVCDACLDVRRDPFGAYLEVEGVTYPLERRQLI